MTAAKRARSNTDLDIEAERSFRRAVQRSLEKRDEQLLSERAHRRKLQVDAAKYDTARKSLESRALEAEMAHARIKVRHQSLEENFKLRTEEQQEKLALAARQIELLTMRANLADARSLIAERLAAGTVTTQHRDQLQPVHHQVTSQREKCPICFEAVCAGNQKIISCGHQLHPFCFEQLKASAIGDGCDGVMCPLCRHEEQI
jgi:hypothetical protein